MARRLIRALEPLAPLFIEEPLLSKYPDEEGVRAAAREPHRWRNPGWRGPDGALCEW